MIFFIVILYFQWQKYDINSPFLYHNTAALWRTQEWKSGLNGTISRIATYFTTMLLKPLTTEKLMINKN